LAEKSDSQNDDEEKSEEPTQRRLDKAKEEGDKPFSKELVTLSLLFSSLICVVWIIPLLIGRLSKHLIPFMDRPHEFDVDGHLVNATLWYTAKHSMVFLFPIFALLFCCVLASGLGQKWGAIRFKSLKPKMENISLSKGINRIFSKQNLVDNLKNFIKLFGLFIAIYFTINQEREDFSRWKYLTLTDFLFRARDCGYHIYVALILSFIVIGAFDFIYQRYAYFKKLKMSRYDIKQEHKETEGNPEVKGKLKSLRQQRAQKRMMANVPKATVVLANPTHYAIALLWDEQKFNAPIVVAKGTDDVAQRIKELAKKSNVPVIENPSLTRALYEVVDLEDEIPPKFYKAVAEVIRIVMRLKSNYFR